MYIMNRRFLSYIIALGIILIPELGCQKYPEVKIGEQIWMSKNLDVITFRNGDTIPEAKTNEEWNQASVSKQPAWCYYNNEPANGVKYGKLYNWYAVNDPRGLAPAGWHIPRASEWSKVTKTLGGVDIAGSKMKSKKDWKNEGNGTNSSGFEGLPGGIRYDHGRFVYLTECGFWCSSDEDYEIPIHALSYNYSVIAHGTGKPGHGYSIRCIKD